MRGESSQPARVLFSKVPMANELDARQERPQPGEPAGFRRSQYAHNRVCAAKRLHQWLLLHLDRLRSDLEQPAPACALPGDQPKVHDVSTTDLADFFLVPPPLGGGPPTIGNDGVVNGASFQLGITPNGWATIQGSNLAPKTDDWTKSIVNGQFPAALDTVSVSLGGKAAYMYFITPSQLNFLVPPDLPLVPVQVTVTANGQTSAAASVTSSQFAPAFFLWPGSQAVATRHITVLQSNRIRSQASPR